MKVALELTGEHPTLPRSEGAAVAAALGAWTDPRPSGRILIIETAGPLEPFVRRLAMTRRLIEVHGTAVPEVDAICSAAEGLRVEGRRFEVRCSRLDRRLDPDLPRRVAQRLGRQLSNDGVVDLERPEVTVRVLMDTTAVVGIERARIDRSSFEARHVEERAHFSPVSMHPRLARALVNLTRVRAGERIFDPFAGTGGLVLEAALIGCQAIGSDLDPAMVRGARSTLEQYGVAAELVEGDVSEVAAKLAEVEAIVTDPPYGRASSTHREEVGKLYERFFIAASGVLCPGGRLVCVLPRAEDIELARDRFDVLERHAWYVHGSLTRNIFVLRRPA